MLGSKSFLCVDFGAGSLKLAEFDVGEAGTLRLLRYGLKPLGLAGSQDAAREGVVLRSLQELLSDKSFGAKSCNVCAPGYHVFSKFIKLPPVDSSKITQIIQYEAQQNVPFPLEEVVWDYQILGTLPSGELEVLLVAIKSDVVEGLFRAAESVNLRLDLVDASPAALCNAFRYNYGDLEGCSMLLDIGAKTSNVLFFDKGKVFSRSINIGANSITQEFAAEAKIPFAEGEKLKIAEGFVSLGGAYEEPDNPRQAAISKIARQVMTRLHIQVNQTIQFFRSQQGGVAPQRLFLAGGASIMPYTREFFQEKLNIPVDYFNPFRNIEIDPGVNLEELAKVAHAFGEVVGLGLRNPAQCPVELNLIPRSILKRQELNQKKPYFIAAAASLIAMVFISGWFFDKLSKEKRVAIDNRAPMLESLKQKADQLQSALNAKKTTQGTVDQLTEWMGDRFRWADIIAELRKALESTEATTRRPGVRTAVWVEKMAAENAEVPEAAQEEEQQPRRMMMDYRMLMRYGLLPKGMRIVQDPSQGGGGEPGAGMVMPGAAAEPAKTESKSTNEISVINLTCRGVSWHKVFATADSELAIAFLRELQASPMFASGTNGTQFAGTMEQDETTGTFKFDVKLKLAQPIKF
ncbi:MAG TPA: type IV pilus assembly protein PilM [Verrucomicrobiota bacterium]|nr:type IV pilus assembly protein PilM [Verrucomicrobiota bacterium]HNU50643.1 type IV pilus assembly protein PilM [Verrucomicrobiota bacterium]